MTTSKKQMERNKITVQNGQQKGSGNNEIFSQDKTKEQPKSPHIDRFLMSTMYDLHFP